MLRTVIPLADKKRRNDLLKNIVKCRQLYLIFLLPLCSTLLFSYQPMYGVQIAFRAFSPALGITKSPWVGLDNVMRFISSYLFSNIVTNTLRLSMLGLVTGMPLAIIFALMLNTVRNLRLKKTIQTITYAPYFISIVVLVGMINMFLSPTTGIYGNVYRLLNDGQIPAGITGKANSFVPIYILSGIWQGLGWSSIIYLAALSGVDPELHEAAVIDGASRLRRIFAVDIPAITPTISIMLILSFGGVMSVGFDKAYLMQTSLNTRYSEVISTYVYKVGLLGGISGFSYGAAIGFFNSVINCLMLVIVNFIARKVSPDNTSLF